MTEISFVPLSVLIASFLGSFHCLGMCGGIALIAARTPNQAFYYQVGRLVGYVTLGASAGWIGQRALGAFTQSWLSLISPLSMGALFMYLGVLFWRRQSLHIRLPTFLGRPLTRLIHSIDSSPARSPGTSGQFHSRQQAPTTAFSIGLLSISLPCGYLYGFVIGAATTQSAAMGAMILLMFWLGTAPILALSPAIVQRLLLPVQNRFPKAAGFVLLSAGAFTVFAALGRHFM